MSLQDITLADFEGRVGEAFRVGVDGLPEPLQAELVEAEPAGEGPPDARAPFSLVFRGPYEPVLPQGVYQIDHDELGTLLLFIVPIARNDDGVRYQAVFS